MFSTSKRINRATYLTGLIIVPFTILLGQIVLGTILGLIPGLQTSLNKPTGDKLVNTTGTVVMAIYFPFLLIIFLYLLLLVKQRSNDVSERGLIVFLVAVLSLIGMLILAFIPGKKFQNKYGFVPNSGVRLRH